MYGKTKKVYRYAKYNLYPRDMQGAQVGLYPDTFFCT